MSFPDESSFAAERFSGVVRLFPLPNLVVFPHVMQPLHIFEPRYCQMLEDALADDRLIAMATLAEGWESDYEGRPPLGKFACLCRVATTHRKEDGTYNLLIIGLRRIALVSELPPAKLYRQAKAEIMEDVDGAASSADRMLIQQKLLLAFKQVLPDMTEAREQLDKLLGQEVSLGMLTDIIGFTLNADVSVKERLLGEENVLKRAELLLEHLSSRQQRSSASVFPPDFSAN